MLGSLWLEESASGVSEFNIASPSKPFIAPCLMPSS
jgi:hypothetical protein